MRITEFHTVRTLVVIGLIILLFLTSINVAAQNSSLNSNNAITRARQTPEINVYFHEGLELDTIPGNKTQINPTRTTLNDQDEVEFTLTPNLNSNLMVEGKSIGASTFGFWIYLQIYNPPTNTQAEVTFTIKENNNVIARNSNPVTIPGNQDTRNQYPLEVPFTQSSKSTHTFTAKSQITLSMNVSITGPTPVVASYDRGENDGYLLFPCNPVITKTVAPYHGDDTAGDVFYPNLPNDDQRIMKFKGSVKDSFGAYNIREVRIGVENIIPEPQTATYVYSQEDAEGYFELEYQYPKGLPAGPHSITAYITDQSDNNYFALSSLTISSYGVYLECANNSGYGDPSQNVRFKIDVYNVGANSDSITLVADPTPKTWTTIVVGGDTTGLIGPGNKEPKTIEVTVPQNALKNEKCVVTAVGWSVNDQDPKETYTLDPAINVVAKAKFSFDFQLTTGSAQTVGNGGVAEYKFKLWNTGSENDKYTVSVNEQPLTGTDWSAKLSTTSSGAIKVSDYEYTLEVEQTKIAEFSLTVTAPDTTPNEDEQMVLTVTCRSENITDVNFKTQKHDTTTTLKGTVKPGKVTIDTKTQTIVADPGTTIDAGINMDLIFDFSIINEDEVLNFNVQLTLKNMPGSWSYSLTTTDFTLNAGDSKDISLTLEILETEYAGSYSFEIEASYTPEDTNDVDIQKTSKVFAVTIPEVVDILLDSKEKELTTELNQEVEYTLTVTYLGNVKDFEIRLDFNDLSNWEIDISKTSITFDRYGKTETVKLTMKPLNSAKNEDKGIVEISVKERDSGSLIGDPILFKTTIKKDTTKEITEFFTEYLIFVLLVVLIVILSVVVWKRHKDMGGDEEEF